MRLVTNELHQLSVYISPDNPTSISLKRVSKVHHANVNDFSIGPNLNNPFVALFTPEHSGKTSRVTLYRFNPTLTFNGEENASNNSESFVDVGVSRSLFRYLCYLYFISFCIFIYILFLYFFFFKLVHLNVKCFGDQLVVIQYLFKLQGILLLFYFYI